MVISFAHKAAEPQSALCRDHCYRPSNNHYILVQTQVPRLQLRFHHNPAAHKFSTDHPTLANTTPVRFTLCPRLYFPEAASSLHVRPPHCVCRHAGELQHGFLHTQLLRPSLRCSPARPNRALLLFTFSSLFMHVDTGHITGENNILSNLPHLSSFHTKLINCTCRNWQANTDDRVSRTVFPKTHSCAQGLLDNPAEADSQLRPVHT